MTVYIVVKGSLEIFDDINEALEMLKKNDGSFLLILDKQPVILKLANKEFKEKQERRIVREATRQEAGRNNEVVALVFDQMFRGFSEILARELVAERYEFHEILGRGIERPIVTGRIHRWPANDDYDVLKIVEELSKHKWRVVFYTGDKRLARQAEALALSNLFVAYMPPNEYPGKESIAKKMIEIARKTAEV